MDRRAFLTGIAALGIGSGAGFFACSPSKPLRISIHPWIGYETLYLAREFNWLPVAAQLLEGKDASASLAALQSGQADAACLTLDEALRARASGLPLSVALIFDISAGADMVLARASIGNPAELRGKRLGVEKNALGALVLGKFLAFAGLKSTDLQVIDLPPDLQLSAWKKGEIDAVVTYEPTATYLLREGAHRLFDSRQMPDTIFDVLAVRGDRGRFPDDTLVAVLAAHFRALSHLQTNRQDAIYRIAARQQIAADEVQRALAGIVLPSLAANRSYLGANDRRFREAAEALNVLMAGMGLLNSPDRLDGLMSSRWLPPDEA